ncbi:hypothetical protein B738_06794 [Photorhabdus temperata subsp. temperata M1021]|nr:hypothetical protein B738_06794 [Photorhabdus temperata subsp. temperata M1021]
MCDCSGCGEPLGRAKWRDGRKSCPSCSLNRGYHVFYEDDAFGMRNMGDGRRILQSYCHYCRGRGRIYHPAFTCNADTD